MANKKFNQVRKFTSAKARYEQTDLFIKKTIFKRLQSICAERLTNDTHLCTLYRALVPKWCGRASLNVPWEFAQQNPIRVQCMKVVFDMDGPRSKSSMWLLS